MASRSRARVDEARRRFPEQALEEALSSLQAPRRLGDFGDTFDLIAEVKPRSPSEGAFPVRDPATAAAEYEAGGARMISVLTEPSEFGGSLDHLEPVRARTTVPVMAKDFLVDSYQVGQARLAGADGVLLIVRLLDDDTLSSMMRRASALGMFSLVEAFDADDLGRIELIARGTDQVLAGVNCRDLDTLEVRPERHRELAGQMPTGLVTVAESAISAPEDAERVAGVGYRGALVGSALMRSGTPGPLVSSLLLAGRAVRAALP